MNSSPQASRVLPVSSNPVSAVRRRLPVFAPSPDPVSAHGEDADGQAHETFLQLAHRQGKQLLAGWATSLLLHFFLLIGLALFSFGGASSQLGLELAFADSEEAVELDDVQFEMPALDEPDFSEELESVLVPEEGPDEPVLEFEEPVVALAEPLIDPATLSFEPAKPASETAAGAGGGEHSEQDSGASFYGIESDGNRFVYVIDASTSMLEGGRWRRAVSEVLESISQLESSQRFLVLTYNSGFQPMLNMPMSKIDLVRATRGNKRRLADWLLRQQPNGVTMPAGAMLVGLSLNVDAIYLLSDGLLMDRTDVMLRQHNRPRLLRFGGGRKTPVHTIAMDVSGDGASLLQEIAEENAGIFRVVQ